jgi:hypothetical protein
VTHELKTWPEHFAPVLCGEKKAELRKDDRNFQVGDELILREYEPTKHAYTGRAVIAKITHILRGGEWLTPGYAMLSGRRMGEAKRRDRRVAACLHRPGRVGRASR